MGLCDKLGLVAMKNATAVVSSNSESQSDAEQPLRVGSQTLSYGELMTALQRYGMMPSLVKEIVVDQATADVALSPAEAEKAVERFMQVHQLRSEDQCKTYLSQRGLTLENLPQMAQREQRLHKFKQESWGNKVESHFLQRKNRLDRVLYSLIRTREAGLAQELYFRIQDDGQPFAELARQYSDGQESQTGGLIGPVELSVPHPSLARVLSISKPGQLWPPNRIGDWFIIVRLEKFLPAKLDEPTRQRLIDELYNTWLMEQVQITMKQMDSWGAVSASPAPGGEPSPAETMALGSDGDTNGDGGS